MGMRGMHRACEHGTLGILSPNRDPIEHPVPPLNARGAAVHGLARGKPSKSVRRVDTVGVVRLVELAHMIKSLPLVKSLQRARNPAVFRPELCRSSGANTAPLIS